MSPPTATLHMLCGKIAAGKSTLTAELAKGFGLPKDTQGLLVSSVKEDSPADAAGIKAGAVITQVVRDKRILPVKDVKEFRDLASKADELMVFVKSNEIPGAFVTLSKAKKD